MNEFLKENNIKKAAQRATSVLSVVNHAPVDEMKLKEKIKVLDVDITKLCYHCNFFTF